MKMQSMVWCSASPSALNISATMSTRFADHAACACSSAAATSPCAMA